MAELDDFAGFGPDAMAFLDGLAADNSKAYFDAHRSTYGEQVAVPLKQLVVAVGNRLAASVAPDIRYAPKVGGSLFRINRDLRFSKDKTPYNTHLDAVWWTGESAKTSAGFIMRITPNTVLTGVGIYAMDGARLDRYRDAVVGSAGEELDAIVTSLRRSVRGATMSDASRQRVPKGYDPEHPRADYLRRDGFHVSADVKTPASITTARFAPWATDRLAKFSALHRWLVANL